MRATTVELTHEEYRTAWHTLGLGTRHWNMDLPGLPELTEQQRRTQMSGTLDGLRARGLADHHGIAPELEDALRLLANPAREINGWARTGAGQVRLLAGSRGDWAALAVLDEHRLLVQPAHGGRPGLTGEQLENRLIRGGVTLADARSFAVMMRGPKPGGGRFGATRRDRDGIRHSGGIALVYLATERGGYTVAPRRGPDGSAWTTLAPATLAQLARRIGRLLSDISHQPSDQR